MRTYKGKTQTHYFINWIQEVNLETFTGTFECISNQITLNGSVVDLLKYSYFATENEIESLVIEGQNITIEEGLGDFGPSNE